MKISSLKLARIASGMRQIDVAFRLGVSPSMVSYWENELRRIPEDVQKKLKRLYEGKKVEVNTHAN